MIHYYLVTVETDDNYLDAPDVQAIANEIQTNLEWDMPLSGIVAVRVQQPPACFRPRQDAFTNPLSDGGDV